MIVAEKNRERRAPAGRIQKSLQRLIAALEKELSSLDGDIDSFIEAEIRWKQSADNAAGRV